MTDSHDIDEDEKMDEQSEVLNSDKEPQEEGKLLIHHILLQHVSMVVEDPTDQKTPSKLKAYREELQSKIAKMKKTLCDVDPADHEIILLIKDRIKKMEYEVSFEKNSGLVKQGHSDANQEIQSEIAVKSPEKNETVLEATTSTIEETGNSTNKEKLDATKPSHASEEKENAASSRNINPIVKKINILLLGETGVGKSTFINALVNYLSHEKLEDAAKNVICLIPSYFTMCDQATYQMKRVSLGKPDINENHRDGASATQRCKCYVFTIGGIEIKLIDTPGIGDTRGVETDGTNMRNLLNFISQYEEIHAICVLLKPNNARVGVVFKYCILQLLTHLNKSASRNIIFLFTNARGTFYMPGDSAPSLMQILGDIKKKPPHVDIKFDKSNIYCLDNESFRFLMATSEPNNVEFGPEERKQFETSWERSAKECERLIRYIMKLPPHLVQDTVSINTARTTILLLTQPLGDIAKNIADNIMALESHKKKIFEWEGDIETLRKNLYIPSVDITSTPLKEPKTVCGHPDCCEKMNVDGTVKIHYKTACHYPCYLNQTDGNVIGNSGLLDCLAFNTYKYTGGRIWCKGSELCPDNEDKKKRPNEMVRGYEVERIKSDNCNKCKHSFQTHLHIFTETRIIHKKVEDKQKSKQIKNTEEAVTAQNEKMDELQTRIDDLKDEREKITKSTAKFACFLRNNALTPFNDAFEDYLKHVISNEKSGLNAGADNQNIVDSLNTMLEAHKEEKEIMERAMKDGHSDKIADISSKSIQDSIDELCKLKIYGPKIKDGLQMHKELQKVVHSHHNEVECDVKSEKTPWWKGIWKVITNFQ